MTRPPEAAARYRPESPLELQECMREAHRSGERLAVRGSGTAEDWGGRLGAVDAVVDTGAMQRLITYNPTDMTVAVQAGMKLGELQKVLSQQRQWVSLDPPRGATVGGVLATADAGPSRHAFGTPRDSVIGLTVVLADGTRARSGGHVIKNVAGYDLAKVFHGSLGTLGVVAEVVLRVRPVPSASGTLAVDCSAQTAFELSDRMMASALEPVAVQWCDGTLLVRLAGTQRGVEERRAQAVMIAGGAGRWTSDDFDCWRRVADISRGTAGDTVLRIGTRPSLSPLVASRVDELARARGVETAMTSALHAGIHAVRIRGGDVPAHAGLVDALRRDAGTCGGSAVMCRWADGLADLTSAWGEPPPAVSLLRAVKHAFDPDDRLGRGRFAPWF